MEYWIRRTNLEFTKDDQPLPSTPYIIIARQQRLPNNRKFYFPTARRHKVTCKQGEVDKLLVDGEWLRVKNTTLRLSKRKRRVYMF